MANSVELQAQRDSFKEGLAKKLQTGEITKESYDAQINKFQEQIYQAQENEARSTEVEASHSQSSAEKSEGIGDIFSLAVAPLAIARSRPQIIEEDDEYKNAFSQLETKEKEEEYVKNFKTQYEERYGKGKTPSEDEIAVAKINRQVDNHILAKQNAIQNIKEKIEKKSKGNIFDKISGARLKAKLNRYSRNELKTYRSGRDPTINFLARKARLNGLRIASSQGLKGEALRNKVEQYRKETLKKLLGDYWVKQQSVFERTGIKDPKWRDKLERKRSNYTNHINKLMSSEASLRSKFSFKNFLPKRVSLPQGFASSFSRGLSSGLNGLARGISNLGNGIFNGISKVGNGIKNILNNLQNILGAVSKLGGLNLPLLVGLIIGGIILILIISGFTLLGGGGGNNSSSSISGSTSGSCPSSSSVSQMPQILKSQFNISITGNMSNSTYIQEIYTTVCNLSGYKFMGLLNNSSINVSIALSSADNSSYKSCAEHVATIGSNNYQINFYPCNANSGGDSFLITHELGHIIQFQNPSLVAQFCSTVYNNSSSHSSACRQGDKSAEFIPTYNCGLEGSQVYHQSDPTPAECFSDMVGEYLNYKSFQDCVTQNGKIVPFGCNDIASFGDSNYWSGNKTFSKSFKDYYTFAQNNIFQVISSSSGGGINYVAPSSNYCNNSEYKMYLANNPFLHLNFGDPVCDFNTNLLLALIKKTDPLNYNTWYFMIAKHESGFDPNAWVHCNSSGCTPDPHGAWGLFQMGSATPPGQPSNVPGAFHGNIYDRGDINWQLQVFNAIKTNCNLIKSGREWRYWGTATSLWGQNVTDPSCNNL